MLLLSVLCMSHGLKYVILSISMGQRDLKVTCMEALAMRYRRVLRCYRQHWKKQESNEIFVKVLSRETEFTIIRNLPSRRWVHGVIYNQRRHWVNYVLQNPPRDWVHYVLKTHAEEFTMSCKTHRELELTKSCKPHREIEFTMSCKT